MEHNLTLITTIAAGFGLALVFGFGAEKLKLPAIVGYLLAGIEIVLRTHNEEESQRLRSEGAATVFHGEEELAKGMTAHVLQRFQRTAPG